PVTETPSGRQPVRGTPHYMSPEQARGEPLDERSDVFSLGTTFFHVFTGRMPFDGPGPAEVIRQIAAAEPPRLAEVAPDLPVPLAVIVGRMLAGRREERYQDVAVLLSDLESYVTRGLLPASESGSFPAADGGAVVAAPTGQETAAYMPAVPSDPAVTGLS